MELNFLAGDCDSGDCPTVYTTSNGTVAVQGVPVDYPTPEGEAIVEIPQTLIAEAYHALNGRTME
jgi:hypothetical protein